MAPNMASSGASRGAKWGENGAIIGHVRRTKPGVKARSSVGRPKAKLWQAKSQHKKALQQAKDLLPLAKECAKTGYGAWRMAAALNDPKF